MIFLYALPKYYTYLDEIEKVLHAAKIAHTCDRALIQGCENGLEMARKIASLPVTATGLSIVIDRDTVLPFNYFNKMGKILCAPGYDEHSARMTRDHNGTQILVIGAEITAQSLAASIALAFAQGEYSGGRHQIRVDMLHQMTRGGC